MRDLERTLGRKVSAHSVYAAARGVFPRGRRLGIVSISGGGGVQIADRAERTGFEVPPPGAPLRRRLEELVPLGSPGNPVALY